MASLARNFNLSFCYHIYNCGVGKTKTYISSNDYERFLETVVYYLRKQKMPFSQFTDLKNEDEENYLEKNPITSDNRRLHILAYCLMPNHFHFLISPESPGGISSFMADVCNSYTKYFNIKNRRIGSLFQGTFKSKLIGDAESFLQVSRYIHLNPILSKKLNWESPLESYPYSSYFNWITNQDNKIVSLEVVRKFIEYNPSSNRSFVMSKLDQEPCLGIEKLVL